MKKLFVILSLSLVMVLASCGGDGKSDYNFRARQNDYLISKDHTVLLEYKTDENGKLIRLTIDRLLTVSEMLTMNPEIDYNTVIEGFDLEIFMEPQVGCFLPRDTMVPINIEIGTTKFRFRNSECSYQEVDRHNDYKSSSIALELFLTDTIHESTEEFVNIVVFEAESETFIDVQYLPHTLRTLGVNGIEFGDDFNGANKKYLDFISDMKIFEQYMLKYQESELAINEIIGYTEDVNLLDFGNIDEITAIIEEFTDLYEAEITAIKEFEKEVGINQTEDDVDDEEEPTEEETGGDEV